MWPSDTIWCEKTWVIIGSGNGLLPVWHMASQTLVITGSGNGLALKRYQAITRTNDDLLSIGPLRIKSSEICVKVKFLFNKMPLQMLSAKWQPCCSCLTVLTHWGRVTHICVGKLIIFGSDNGLSPDRRQAIIWTNAGLLLIGPLGTNFSEILIEILTFSFKKMRLKVSSAKWRLFGLGLNELTLF